MNQHRLELKGELRQMLAPEMLQLLKLLQLPTLALQQLVRQELETNPLLEEAPEESEAQEAAGTAAEEEPAGEDWDKIDWKDYLQEEAGRDDQNTETAPEVSGFPQLSCRKSFREELLSQLRIVSGDEGDLDICELIIGNLDDDGFLKVPLEEIAAQAGCQTTEVEQALKKVQGLDPPGIGARDIRESLLLQLERRGRQGSLAWRIVADHFALLEQQKLSAMARALGATMAEVQEAQREIAALSPKPGVWMDTEAAEYIYPDFIVERVGDDFQVLLNDGQIPRLRLAPEYKQILRASKKSSPEDRQYVLKKLESARFLIRMIEQRRRTVKKILEAIFRRQRRFLEQGLKGLQPMTMGQIAQDIEMHESTVSRVVQNKYVMTPHGLVALRKLFGGGLPAEGGQDSALGIRERIAEMIKREDPRRPLTDGQIAKALIQEGIRIARRTVAKYREEEKILPARLRRRSWKPSSEMEHR